MPPTSRSARFTSFVTDPQLRALIETIPGLVWLAGIDGAATSLNRRWLEYTGLSQADAAGWGWTVAIHPDDLDRLITYWRSLLLLTLLPLYLSRQTHQPEGDRIHATVGKVALHERGDVRGRPDQVMASGTACRYRPEDRQSCLLRGD
jgi:PAS domain S-box-containing protein